MNVDALRNWKPAPVAENYDAQRTILYALGIGLRPEGDDLRYVFEEGLMAFPTMAVVLADEDFGSQAASFGVKMDQALHGEHALEIHRPIGAKGKVIGQLTVDAIKDRGPEKGAALMWSRRLSDAESGELIATTSFTVILRGNGGFGGSWGQLRLPHPVPSRPADLSVSIGTRTEQAAIYRLSGDLNPLHIDPSAAHRGGFDRPILHGLCSYAIAARAIVATMCKGDPQTLKRFDVRFAAPVFPGETLEVQIWREAADQAAFVARVIERDVIVLTNGLAAWHGS